MTYDKKSLLAGMAVGRQLKGWSVGGSGGGGDSAPAAVIWKLRTDYARAFNYLNGDQSAISYIRIKDDTIDFIVATVATPVTTEQLSWDGDLYYWTTAEHTTITLEVTDWPVIAYVYDEENKAVMHLGSNDELLIRYVTSGGEDTDITLSDFVDAKHRRLASCEIDTVNGEVTYTVEGSEEEYGLTFTVNGDTVTYTWPDGHTCEVTVI